MPVDERTGLPAVPDAELPHDGYSGPWYDLGQGHYLKFLGNGNGTRLGAIWSHPRPDGQGRCEGYFGWGKDRPAEKKWTVVSEKPLTITPSLHCTVVTLENGTTVGCGAHGHIRDGRYQPC